METTSSVKWRDKISSVKLHLAPFAHINMVSAQCKIPKLRVRHLFKTPVNDEVNREFVPSCMTSSLSLTYMLFLCRLYW